MKVELVNPLELPARSGEGPGQRQGDAIARVDVLVGKRHGSVEMNEPELRARLAQLNESSIAVQHRLRFFADEESGRTVITVIDVRTEEVIRQIPPEDVLRMARMIRQELADAGEGIILEAKA